MNRIEVPITEIVHALEGMAGNTDTDRRWIAATALREIPDWQAISLWLTSNRGRLT